MPESVLNSVLESALTGDVLHIIRHDGYASSSSNLDLFFEAFKWILLSYELSLSKYFYLFELEETNESYLLWFYWSTSCSESTTPTKIELFCLSGLNLEFEIY